MFGHFRSSAGAEITTGLLQQIEGARNIDELSGVLDQLAEIMKGHRSPGENAERWFRDVAYCIARMRTVMSELEQDELRARGASRTMADRYVEMESAIRSLSNTLRELMQDRAQ